MRVVICDICEKRTLENDARKKPYKKLTIVYGSKKDIDLDYDICQSCYGKFKKSLITGQIWKTIRK